MMTWDEYCEVYNITKKDKKEIENLIMFRKRYLKYLKKQEKEVNNETKRN